MSHLSYLFYRVNTGIKECTLCSVLSPPPHFPSQAMSPVHHGTEQHPLRRQKGSNPSPSANNTLATNPQVGVSLLGSGISASVFPPSGRFKCSPLGTHKPGSRECCFTTSTVQPLEKRVLVFDTEVCFLYAAKCRVLFM